MRDFVKRIRKNVILILGVNWVAMESSHLHAMFIIGGVSDVEERIDPLI
ncbi:MAG: hypothetical protein HWN66_02960 [Candidatus Helarchaeota archaeon]|nr:hypothetical protein [Candidatus Helarchaeota archaeon]